MKRAKLTCLLTLTCLLLTASISFSGEWMILENEIDPFTDLKRARIGLAYVDGVESYLFIQCENRELFIAVDFNTVNVVTHDVRYRVGKNEARSGAWGETTASTAIGHPQPHDFLDELLTTNPKKLVIQAWSQEGYKQLSFFDLDGINDAVKPIREAECLKQDAS